MSTAYVYKITFEEVPHFYIGVRGRGPGGDPYLGSPKTHRCYWDIYTPKKQILWVFDSWEEACEIEASLIKQNWKNRYCLNRCVAGAFSAELSAKAGKATQERRQNDPEFDAKCKEISRRNIEALYERRRNDPAFDTKYRENSVKNGKKTGAQRWKCTVTGHISTPGPLSLYQKARGIDTKHRKRIG